MTVHPLLRSLLWPASMGFALGVRLRAWMYQRLLEQKRLNGVVVSVGNLTVGGTGKTPMVIWLAQLLLAEGKRVGILIRGYRSSNHTLPAFAADPSLGPTSDEAWLLGRRLGDAVPIGMGADRLLQGRLLERQGTEWFVLDDGFQHLRLARDADIVLIDATDPFGRGLLPAGRGREPKAALRRADIVIITRTDHAPAVEAVVRRCTTAPILYAQTQLEGFFPLDAESGGSPVELRGRKVFAFCAIGNPQAFFDDLGRWGLAVVGRKSFRDHHRYSGEEAVEIERQAQAFGAGALVCTEKDVYNLRGVHFAGLPAYYSRVSMQVSDAERFRQSILDTVQRRRKSQP